MVNYYGKDTQNDMNSHHGEYHSDDENLYREDEVMNVQDWTSYYSDDLYNMWSHLREYMSHTGCGAYMMQHADYTNFAQYCYSMSYGHPYADRVQTRN